MSVNELIEIAEVNKGYEQMDGDQYQCLIALIENETITSVEQLNEYMVISE
ncbi:hypothetical protein [Priestia megaterium]|uniref:hypothetical protein n=1 Tax=Priestia megaterium TaxID=1404 RepID=UPI0015E34EE6|nr:hypothetical protein [Priestia megaterium]